MAVCVDDDMLLPRRMHGSNKVVSIRTRTGVASKLKNEEHHHVSMDDEIATTYAFILHAPHDYSTTYSSSILL